jgi:hypothetical protein
LAQLQTISLGTPVTPSAARVAATNAAKLPFFDDFSYGLKLNTNNWLSSGGTLVNNDYATNHPTINMLTFDGLKADGNPYNFVNSLAEDILIPLRLKYWICPIICLPILCI